MKCDESFLAINAKVVKWEIGGVRPAEETENIVARFLYPGMLDPCARNRLGKKRIDSKLFGITNNKMFQVSLIAAEWCKHKDYLQYSAEAFNRLVVRWFNHLTSDFPPGLW